MDSALIFSNFRLLNKILYLNCKDALKYTGFTKDTAREEDCHLKLYFLSTQKM